MKREDVSKIIPGITSDQLDSIMNLHGADITAKVNEITTLKAEKTTLTEQLSTANSKLEGYDPEWKAKAEQAKTDAAAQVAALEKGYALERKASGLKFSSESAKKAFLSDLEAAELPVQEDKVLGFEDFLSKYKESDPSAFLPDKPAPTITVPGQGPASKKTGQQLLDEKYKNNPFYHPKGE